MANKFIYTRDVIQQKLKELDATWSSRRIVCVRFIEKRIEAIKNNYGPDISDEQESRLKREDSFCDNMLEVLSDAESFINESKNIIENLEREIEDRDRKIEQDSEINSQLATNREAEESLIRKITWLKNKPEELVKLLKEYAHETYGKRNR